MAIFNINGTDYDIDNLSDEVKQNIVSIKFVQEELQRHNALIAVYKTAEAGYARAIQNGLDSEEN